MCTACYILEPCYNGLEVMITMIMHMYSSTSYTKQFTISGYTSYEVISSIVVHYHIINDHVIKLRSCHQHNDNYHTYTAAVTALFHSNNCYTAGISVA